MPRKRAIRLECPTCKKPVRNTGQNFPFCSERCRLLDLGKWASGEYVISSPVEDVSDSLPEESGRDPGGKHRS